MPQDSHADPADFPADYDIEEIQDALLAYDGEINILVAPKDYINKRTSGPVALLAVVPRD